MARRSASKEPESKHNYRLGDQDEAVPKVVVIAAQAKGVVSVVAVVADVAKTITASGTSHSCN
jgi:hypothetical protein